MTTRTIIVLVAAATLAAKPLEPVEYSVTLDPSSEIRIEGSSTLGRFDCVASSFRGSGAVAPNAKEAARTRPAAAGEGARANLSVEVASFDCGMGAMNRDLVRALQGHAHPQIEFKMKHAHVIDRDDDRARIHVTGTIQIAGVEQSIATVVQAEQIATRRFRVTGSKRLFMTDFGISPPTALLGLIRADDRITVNFDLVAVAAGDDEETTTTLSGRTRESSGPMLADRSAYINSVREVQP